MRAKVAAAGAAGMLLALLLGAFVLGARITNHGPGLWTLRFERVIECGLDYNGPPYTDRVRLWLTCGEGSG